MKRMITTIFFAAVTFPKRVPRIIIHLARNAENGGVLMSVTLPNLNHSFIFPVPVPVSVPVPVPDPDPVPVPDPDPVPVPDFRVFHTPVVTKKAKHNKVVFDNFQKYIWKCYL